MPSCLGVSNHFTGLEYLNDLHVRHYIYDTFTLLNKKLKPHKQKKILFILIPSFLTKH